MARCPFAQWDEISGPSGSYTGGPFKVVHHTTEGSSYAGARAAFAANRSDPHFTVDGALVYQHIDTEVAARALRNADGGVQTNRDSAVQIELVGFAARDKRPDSLATLARLCRWIEAEHGVPQVWPNGLPRWSHSGGDPGGHNRDAMTWDTRAGHYGHSQVPENTHWDPSLTPSEVQIVTPDAVTTPALMAHAQLSTGWTAPAARSPQMMPEGVDLHQIAESAVAALAKMRSDSAATHVSCTITAGGVTVTVEMTAARRPKTAKARTKKKRARATRKRRR